MQSAGKRALATTRNFLQWQPERSQTHKQKRSKQYKNNLIVSETDLKPEEPNNGYHIYRETHFDIFNNLYGKDKGENKRNRFRTEYNKLDHRYDRTEQKRPTELNQNLTYLKDKFVNKDINSKFYDYEVLNQTNLPTKKVKKIEPVKDNLLIKLEKDIRRISQGKLYGNSRKSKMQTRKNKILAIQRRQEAQSNALRKRKLTRLLKVEGIIN